MVEYSVEYGYFGKDRDLEWSRRLQSASLSWEQFLLSTGGEEKSARSAARPAGAT
jgi:hypothetical protein